MLRFGICGCGKFIENGILPAITTVDDTEAVALFDVSAEQRKRVGDKFGIQKRFDKYDDLLNCDEVDAVYVASPNIFHKEQVIAAARAGKHVFCQKPMGMNSSECEEMLSALTAYDVKMGVGFCFRYAGAQQKTMEIVQAGEIGKPCGFRMSMNFFGYKPETVGWRCDAKFAGGGPLMDLAPHMVDLSCFFLKTKVKSVMAYVSPEKTDVEIETNALILLEMLNGTNAILDTSFNTCHYPKGYTVIGQTGAICREGIDSWRINGKAGGALILHRTDREPLEVSYSTHEYLEREIIAFSNAVESDNEPLVSGRYGLEIQTVIDAIYESGRTGKRCQIKMLEKPGNSPMVLPITKSEL